MPKSGLSADERRVAADAYVIREQAQRQGQELARLVKRDAELEADAAKLRAELRFP